MSRKRILFVNEASFLATGFSVYGLEVISRLYQTDKYEIAELGVYAEDGDPRQLSLPWKFYPNRPRDPQEVAAHDARPLNQFGEWRFDRACLDFKPDIVIDWRDWWMHEFEERSPFRPFFKWVVMPTVDSAPIDEQWLSTYINADAVFTYSEFGRDTLLKQGNGLVKFVDVASPGADLDSFAVVDNKREHKKTIGMPEDVFIIGTVMRNQERKLYPDLIESFKVFLQKAPAELAKRSYLYLHTCYPDVGWNIPRLLKEQDLLNKVLFSYRCQKCGSVFPSFYREARTFCKSCEDYTASLPHVQLGVDRKSLGRILNLFDIYVQYSVCEGFGMPQVEAAACGVPCLAVDYSAMSDIVKKIEGIPIKVQRMFRDPKTHAYRAFPDNADLVDKLLQVASWTEEERLARGKRSRQLVEEYYNWDRTAKTWERFLDEYETIPANQGWDSPSRITQPNLQVPQGLTNEQFVQWAIINVAGRPEFLNTFITQRMVRDLNWGASQTVQGGLFYNEASWVGLQPPWLDYGRKDVIDELLKVCNQKNAWEEQRLANR